MNHGVRPRSLLCTLLVCALVAACDDDPTVAAATDIIPTPSIGEVIPRQGSITITSPVPLDPTSALDPENFVVINVCTGLRVPGALSLNEAGTELSFTPSSPLPFLTPLIVRVQNLLGVNGEQMPQPFTFVVTTEAPPVIDVSWSRMNSPTGDVLSGVDFISRDLGWVISTEGAAVYRTENGGNAFAAVFRHPNVKLAKGIRAADSETVFMVAAPNFGGTTFTTYALFRSVDAGATFDPVFTVNPGDMRSLSLQTVGEDRVLFMVGNLSGRLTVWRRNETTEEVASQSVGTAGIHLGNGGDISPDTTKAVAVGALVVGSSLPIPTDGLAYRSTNSGRTLVPVTLPPNTHALNGAGFVDNTTAMLLGDSSTVLRLDVNTGAVTALGAAQGIPQTEIEEGTGIVQTYSFTKAEFAPNNRQIGWVIGEVLRHDPRPGVADVRRGVILMTRDGGQNFTRQAVVSEPNFGLDFPTLFPPSDISALANDFAVTVGYEGFIAARRADVEGTPGVCSFETR